MGQKTPVKVSKVVVTETVDPKYKTSLPGKLKPKLEAALSKLETEPPPGKNLEPFSVEVSVSLKKTDKGVKAEIKLALTYGDKMFRSVTGTAATESTKPGTIGEDDVDAVIGPAMKNAVDGALSEFKKKAKEK
jgi:hypothetical protein